VDIGQGGHCGFTGNVCQQTSTQEASSAIVQITCDTAIAGNNRITGTGKQTGLSITVGVSGEKKDPTATVLGNIVSQRILLNNATLKAPWEPLNLLA
jgi:hypothetical protein